MVKVRDMWFHWRLVGDKAGPTSPARGRDAGRVSRYEEAVELYATGLVAATENRTAITRETKYASGYRGRKVW